MSSRSHSRQGVIAVMRKSRYYRVDVPRRRRSLRSAVEYAVATFGGLDYAFNNAGIFASAPLADLEIDWTRCSPSRADRG